ncbi:mediator of RNA polymerase II transcription subunit 12 [Monosporozyma unispora]
MSPKKYLLTPPEELHPYLPHNKDSDTINEEDKLTSEIYPDFKPWKHEIEEDQILLNFVSKGYYVSSKVNFESISARSSLHASLPRLSDQLSNQFSKVLQVREQKINKIPATPLQSPSSIQHSGSIPKKQQNKHTTFSINPLAGPDFQLPNRVTLTDNRKEKWLQDLSSPYASLAKTSEFIPHGLKKRQVIEQCYMKHIPLRRATWLIKCCYSIEAQTLKVKHSHSHHRSHSISSNTSTTNPNSTPDDEHHILYKDWTDTFVYILEKLIFEMNQYYNDPVKLKRWKSQISYFLKLLGNCYSLNLLDKEIFFHWLVEFVAKIENFEFLPLTLHILLIFWDDIAGTSANDTNPDEGTSNSFLVSKIADSLLNKYYVISRSKSMINDDKYIINDIKKNNKVKDSLLKIISDLICKLFQEQNLEIFLFQASSWELYKPCLYEIINKLKNPDTKNDIQKKLELISYRNDMFKNNYLLTFEDTSVANNKNNNGQLDILNDESNSLIPVDIKSVFTPMSTQLHTKIINITNIDIDFLKLLDDSRTDFDWPQYIEQNPLRLSQILQLILWSIHTSRISHYESNQLVAKILLLQINSLDGFPEYEIEDTVWSLVFQIGKLSKYNITKNVNLFSLYQLLNILNTYGMVKVPTYIRKLISSGIMYLHDSNDKFFHVSLLINLKISPLMKSQYNMVLRNVMEYEPYYYEKYNFDQLVKSVESKRDQLLNHDNDLNLADLPMSGKIMLGEWCLNYLCSNTKFESVDKIILINTFKIFCLDLKVTQLFYKWIEFVVYHQFLVDVETIETLVNILLRYQMIFSQFINDHILFTKTLIYLYFNVLKKKDPQSYNLITLMPFWKFFMKNFPMALMIDDDLRTELQNVYEEEKLKIEKLEKNKNYVKSLYIALNLPADSNPDDVILNYTEMFQTNIKILLSSSKMPVCSNTKMVELRKTAKCNLLLLMNANNRDYSKFMSIFLKRKFFDNYGLVNLICDKLLTLDQVKRILGMEKVLELCNLKYESPECYILFEGHKEEYLKNKFELVLQACLDNSSKYYSLFIQILADLGSNSKILIVSSKMLTALLNSNFATPKKVIKDLLSYGRENVFFYNEDTVQETESEDEGNDVSMELDANDNLEPLVKVEESLVKLYNSLDFSNLWVFQGFTNYSIQRLKQENESRFNKNLKKFIFDVLECTNYNEICSNLFDSIEDCEIIKLIVNIMEEHFFQRCLEADITKTLSDKGYLLIIIQLITSLFKKIGQTTSSTLVLHRPLFDLLPKIFDKFCKLESQELKDSENLIGVIMKIFTIHQNSVFQYIVEDLQDRRLRENAIVFISNIFKLFEAISLNLRLKLMIYEILSSLKSYCIYVSTTVEPGKSDNLTVKNSSFASSSPYMRSPSPHVSMGQYNSNTPSMNRSISTLHLNIETYSPGVVRFDVPDILLNLPPFQVSSFAPRKDSETDEPDRLDLGIEFITDGQPSSPQQDRKIDNQNQWFIYDKSLKSYICKLHNEPYYNINNYQPPIQACSLNNACFNLTLFDASLDNKNPN